MSDEPVKSKYAFMGWGLSAYSPLPAYKAGDSYKPLGNVELYAVWSYRVYFDANGGHNPPSVKVAGMKESVKIPESIPNKAGFTFVG